ncbi:hypothetical protein AX774_g7165 [Zancudomyces culisetae]|uniref:Secreted protein n=1 Tax=Zancudomyces culisetae TaxID=1213189 RepID=A0A1R1PEX6_ZANCU|nr:hypothetical protein AX774_g7165 [Zancudomyces culisetae]|eukprot:OMH79432.1 hypothetical protein AX774_g7165 [Zancudomyces culisetae]
MIQGIKWTVGLLGLGFMYSAQSKVGIILEKSDPGPANHKIIINVDRIASEIACKPYKGASGTIGSNTGASVVEGGASVWAQCKSEHRASNADDTDVAASIGCASIPDGSVECYLLEVPRKNE